MTLSGSPYSVPRAARLFLSLGGLLGLLSVAGGALAAHLPDAMFAASSGRALAREAVQMGMWHAPALLAVGILLCVRGRRVPLLLAGAAFALGVVLFSGAVGWTGVTGRHLGPVAPTGGSLLMLAWLLLAVDGLRR
ncbi:MULTISPECIES: DUF423 domain-containing protein [Gluconacetobacter]|uniref:DUF423 domain-containing protein n=2 Tax=Gluconacetobacter TaxID=89583 RepID=A0A7W4JGA9_9PROT|nr:MULTISPECIES: DUF423 domain-containing protein [Gluconacetobacter]MBB2170522.1 DUF423 domain-containing protein [Gluconacetobacter asukensis]MBB2180698.1 DUF423 domain-containing protein [Gluconacetobacter tumulicola]